MLETLSDDVIRAAAWCSGAVIGLVGAALLGCVVVASSGWRNPPQSRLTSIVATVACLFHLVLGANLARASIALTRWLTGAQEAMDSFGAPVEREAMRMYDSLSTMVGLMGTTPDVALASTGESQLPTIEYGTSVAAYVRAVVLALAGGALGWLAARPSSDRRSMWRSVVLATLLGGSNLGVGSWYAFEIREVMAAEQLQEAFANPPK